jgi:8-oxo-dGTP pyrophosphatase MutT (NUDIX family)
VTKESSSASARDVDPATPWAATNLHTMYEAKPWLCVQLADVRKPSGQREQHHLVRMPPAVIVVALGNAGPNEADDHVLLAWRHRWVPDLWSWELPGGLIDDGEPAETAAQRELIEETGYRAGRLRQLLMYEPDVGSVRAPRFVFLAEQVERVGRPTERDEGVFEWVRLDTVPGLIARGHVGSSGALIGLLQVLAARQGRRNPPDEIG